ncbi:MAG: nucleotide sugar dehydrogenase, partial [Candidatus Aminicenantales bacterium]
MSQLSQAFEKTILDRSAVIGVVGLGYVGLPLVKAFVNKGFQVLGFDIDARKVSMLNRGQSYIKHISTAELKQYLSRKKLQATSDFTRLPEADAVIICVPTPLDAHRNPDLSYVLNTTRTIAQHLRKGQLVILESTTYPGTTDEDMLPILEKGGLKAGKDFFLAFSPERENPGDPVYSAANTPKVVGGFSKDCLRLADL